MKRILFSHYGVVDGGDACGFTRSYSLAKELVSLGNEVVFLTTQKDSYKFPYKFECRSGVKIFAFMEFFPYRFRKGGFSPLSTILKILFVLFQKADIVHSDTGHRPSSGWPCIIHRFFYRSIYISEWWEHFGIGGIYDDMTLIYKKTIGAYDNLFEERNRLKADGCICISSTLRDRAISLGLKSEDILVLNGGADLNEIPFIGDSRYFRDAFNLDERVFIIGIIGVNDEEVENHIELIESIKRYNQVYGGIQIVCTGKVSLSIRKKYNLDDYFFKVFEWLPYSDFCKLISCPDVFAIVQKVNLRNKSRFPNKLGDYLAASRPIITNSVGEIELYVKKYPEIFYALGTTKQENIEMLRLLVKLSSDREIDYHSIRLIAQKNSWNERAKMLNDFYEKYVTTHTKTIQRRNAGSGST